MIFSIIWLGLDKMPEICDVHPSLRGDIFKLTNSPNPRDTQFSVPGNLHTWEIENNFFYLFA